MRKKVQAVCKNYGVKFIVHTFWRAGLALGADGAHLPLPVCAAMTAAVASAGRAFGRPYTSAEEAKAAIKFGAAYLTAGHIYASSCKQGVPPRGPAFLREICTLSPVPVYAIGGIGLNKEQLDEVLACGAAGACVRSAFMRL